MVTNNHNTHSHITDIRIYPIKSCRGISLPSATLSTSGLSYDRRWMFVDSQHKFLTIRQKSEMTLINTAMDTTTDELVITMGGSNTDNNHDHDEESKRVRVPLEPTAAWLAANTERVTVKIWGTEASAYAYTCARMQRIFRGFFGVDAVRLVMKDPAVPRVCGGNGNRAVLGRVATVAFPDVLPVLMVSESSLAELNSRLLLKNSHKITYERFRPNIVIAGGDPWTEDQWKAVRINGASDSWLSALSGGYLGNSEAIDIDVVARCARCQVPNVDPDTAVKDKHEPWDTLMKYRRIDAGIKFKPCFGMLGCPRNEGKVELGMRFDVLTTTNAHKYLTGF
ncbi:hypothetical protein DV736_g2755, partial [Chaetothyriales sp. CBS 134916]